MKPIETRGKKNLLFYLYFFPTYVTTSISRLDVFEVQVNTIYEAVNSLKSV